MNINSRLCLWCERNIGTLLFCGGMFMVIGLVGADQRLEWGNLRQGRDIFDLVFVSIMPYIGALLIGYAGFAIRNKFIKLEKIIAELKTEKTEKNYI